MKLIERLMALSLTLSTTACSLLGGETVSSTALSLSASNSVIGTYESATFTATGGSSPYTYFLSDGSGELNTSSGAFSAYNEDTVTIGVTDSEGATAYATITVSDSYSYYDDDDTTSDTSSGVETSTSTETGTGNYVWAQSVLGGYYDATGQLSGNHYLPAMRSYGGTMADGSAIPGENTMVNSMHHICNVDLVNQYGAALFCPGAMYE